MTTAQIVSEIFYSLIGLVFALVGVKALRDPGAQKKVTTAIFWFVLAFTFILGNFLPKWITGLCVVIIAVITGINGVKQSANDVPDPQAVRASANKLGYKVFIPALCLALVAVVAATLGGSVPALSWLTANNAIGVSGIVALIVALLLFKAHPKYIVKDGTRLMDNVGPVGIANGVSAIIPEGSKLIACAVYCIAMAVFTIIMGNGFAAFSVITVGIGIPFLIMQGANPVIVGALGLTAGYCGTLCTPMAANFNIMPAALLEVKNKYAIIKSQLPVAGIMLVIHIALMYFFAF